MWMWSTGINRNIVECKVAEPCCILQVSLVLIETLWNVKKKGSPVLVHLNRVLIETLWNVKHQS